MIPIGSNDPKNSHLLFIIRNPSIDFILEKEGEFYD